MKAIIKKLSDGTIAKVGMVVVVMEGLADGNEPNTITEIVDLGLPSRNSEANASIKCYWENGMNDWLWEYLIDLRKATPEEKKSFKRAQ